MMDVWIKEWDTLVIIVSILGLVPVIVWTDKKGWTSLGTKGKGGILLFANIRQHIKETVDTKENGRGNSDGE